MQTTKRFVYAGMEMIAVIEQPLGLGAWVTDTYFWGVDRSQSLGGAGGIGGLLLVDDDTSQYLPGYDGRGNVTMLISESDGSIVAEFEYDPYGELLRKEGAYDKIPFRYQTKWDLGYDSEDDVYYNWSLVDYGMRWYQPANGRFINRDPIGERGGLNLYAFVGNDPMNNFDLLGMEIVEPLNFGFYLPPGSSSYFERPSFDVDNSSTISTIIFFNGAIGASNFLKGSGEIIVGGVGIAAGGPVGAPLGAFGVADGTINILVGAIQILSSFDINNEVHQFNGGLLGAIPNKMVRDTYSLIVSAPTSLPKSTLEGAAFVFNSNQVGESLVSAKKTLGDFMGAIFTPEGIQTLDSTPTDKIQSITVSVNDKDQLVVTVILINGDGTVEGVVETRLNNNGDDDSDENSEEDDSDG